MSDWKINDRALCVNGAPGELPGNDEFNVRKGVIYLVHRVLPTPGGRIFLSIRNSEARHEEGWDQARFRKIVPACDRVEIPEKNKA